MTREFNTLIKRYIKQLHAAFFLPAHFKVSLKNYAIGVDLVLLNLHLKLFKHEQVTYCKK